VQVDQAEERLAEVLGGGVLAKTSAVVPEVFRARGLDAGEDPHGFGLDYPQGGLDEISAVPPEAR
jgi:hypothetical protein